MEGRLDNVERRGALVYLLLCHVGLLISIVIADGVPPAEAYEFSILWAYPSHLWMLLIFSLCCSFASLAITYKRDRIVAVASMLSSMLVVAFLFILPLLRGYYYFGGSDSLYHLGSIFGIINNGHIDQLDYFALYPLLHLLGADVNLITGLDRQILAYPILFTFYSTFAISLLALSRSLHLSREGQAIVLIMGLTPLFGMGMLNFAPFAKATMMIPLVLLTCIRRAELGHRNKRYSLLMVTLIVALVFYHILAAALFIAMMLTFDMVKSAEINVLPRLGIKVRGDGIPIKRSYPYIVLAAIISILWVPKAAIFKEIRQMFLGYFLGGTSSNGISNTIGVLGVAKLGDVLIIVLTTYGATTILLLFASALVFAYVIVPMVKGKEIERKHWQLAAISLLFLGMTVITFLISTSFGLRPLSIVSMILVLLIGAIAPRVMLKRKGIVAVSIFIIILSSVLILSTYPTPLNKISNWQMTETKVSGIGWVAESLPFAPYIYYNDGDYDRASRFIGGLPIYYAHPIPDRFNLTNDVGSKWNESIVAISDQTLDFYKIQYPDYREQWRYDQGDVQRFQASEQVALIYSNDGLYIYRVNR